MWIKTTQSRHTWLHRRSQYEHSYLHSQLSSIQTNNSPHTSTDTEVNICKYIASVYHHSYTLTLISIFQPGKHTSHIHSCTNPIIHSFLPSSKPSVSTFLYKQVFRYWSPCIHINSCCKSLICCQFFPVSPKTHLYGYNL